MPKEKDPEYERWLKEAKRWAAGPYREDSIRKAETFALIALTEAVADIRRTLIQMEWDRAA